MTKIHLVVTIFFGFLLMTIMPASAFMQKGVVKLPGSVLSKNTSGVLRQICHQQIVFITYGSRGGSTVIQLMDGSKPMKCDQSSLTVMKQYEVPATLLNKSDSGVTRYFEISGQKVALFSSRNGASTLLQVKQ